MIKSKIKIHDQVNEVLFAGGDFDLNANNPADSCTEYIVQMNVNVSASTKPYVPNHMVDAVPRKDRLCFSSEATLVMLKIA